MEIEKIHIGQIVENVFYQSNKSKTEFAKDLGIPNQNVNRYFQNPDWSVIKLIMASKSLNHDFGYLLSPCEKEYSKKPKMFIQIEVEDSKIEQLVKMLDSNEVYSIIKK
jgi:hypothetical protein